MNRSGRSALYLLTPLVVLAGITSACGDDDDGDTEALASQPAENDAGDPDGSGTGDTVEVVAVDYGFEGLPERIAAGSTLTLHNDSEREVHELFAFALPPEETRAVDELMALPEEELMAALAGEPAVVLVAPPGEDGMAFVGDGTLEAGRYLVACAIPTGADPEEFMRAAQEAQGGPPDVAGGPPHFVSGMYAELIVE